MTQQEKLFFGDEELVIKEEDAEYISNKANQILDKLDKIDEMINKQAKGWTTDRMGKVELAVLRVAVYEIEFDEDVPTGVAINEAVELAKKFGQEESSGFINGILAKFA